MTAVVSLSVLSNQRKHSRIYVWKVHCRITFLLNLSNSYPTKVLELLSIYNILKSLIVYQRYLVLPVPRRENMLGHIPLTQSQPMVRVIAILAAHL